MTYIATVTSKGQITLPKAIRLALNLQPSDKVLFDQAADRVILEPVKTDLMSLAGSIKVKGKKPVDLLAARKIAHDAVATRLLKAH